MEAKLSDFGLAKMLGMEESKVFTDVRGTIGYMDPEYMTNAKLTCASDIYSFGIVALQLLSGQKVIDLDLDARDQLTRKVLLYVFKLMHLQMRLIGTNYFGLFRRRRMPIWGSVRLRISRTPD